jgi:hypothetical protein
VNLNDIGLGAQANKSIDPPDAAEIGSRQTFLLHSSIGH